LIRFRAWSKDLIHFVGADCFLAQQRLDETIQLLSLVGQAAADLPVRFFDCCRTS
jgi:hypothetical protein